MNIKRGDVVWANLSPTVGKEQTGHRPVLVISNNIYNDLVRDLAIVIPITSVDRGWSNHVKVDSGILGKTSFIMTEQVRTISRRRLTTVAGSISHKTLREVVVWLEDFLVQQ
jgi:mRNA interferase MazF